MKELRDKSGAGMMDCKKALAMNQGDQQAAADFLRAKGLARADKKASRAATEGAIGAYIHAGSRYEQHCDPGLLRSFKSFFSSSSAAVKFKLQ